ncbi:MAG: hypothetical protein E7672_02685 [Ruminococcaceae bacterium]|nr:hypothetical protein [Oscillospiraceae bacterium]
MKRKNISLLRSPKFPLFLIITIPLVLLVIFVGRNITFDHSATRTGDGFSWRGENYVSCDAFYKYDRRVAKTDDNFDVLTVKGDKERNFLILSSFLDSQLYVREGYEIKSSGKITSLHWQNRKTSNKEFCELIEKILDGIPVGLISIENIWQTTDSHDFDEIGLYYENSPVGLMNHYLGYLDDDMLLVRFAYSEIYEDDYIQYYDVFSIENDTADKLLNFFPKN